MGAGLLGFLEGSVILFPIEPLAIPVMATNYKRAFFVAAFLIVGNIVGASLMYALGASLAEPFLIPAFEFFDAADDYADISEALRENGFVALVIAGLSPFPFQAGTTAAGAVGVPFLIFLAAVTLSRGVRYLALALLVVFVGARAGALIERYENLIVIGGIALFAILAAVIVLL